MLKARMILKPAFNSGSLSHFRLVLSIISSLSLRSARTTFGKIRYEIVSMLAQILHSFTKKSTKSACETPFCSIITKSKRLFLLEINPRLQYFRHFLTPQNSILHHASCAFQQILHLQPNNVFILAIVLIVF